MRRNRRVATVALVAVLVQGGLSGCGGDSNPTGGSSPPSSDTTAQPGPAVTNGPVTQGAGAIAPGLIGPPTCDLRSSEVSQATGASFVQVATPAEPPTGAGPDVRYLCAFDGVGTANGQGGATVRVIRTGTRPPDLESIKRFDEDLAANFGAGKTGSYVIVDRPQWGSGSYLKLSPVNAVGASDTQATFIVGAEVWNLQANFLRGGYTQDRLMAIADSLVGALGK